MILGVEAKELKSLRLTLRPIRREDVGAIVSLASQDVFELEPFISLPFNATEWIESKLDREAVVLCLLVLADEIPVGTVQIVVPKGDTHHYLSLGYWFGREYWGQGYATEAVRTVIEYVSRPGIPEIYAAPHRDNIASIRVLEKCGFVACANGPATLGPDIAWYRRNPT